jgi:hypothetical protein
MKENFGVCLKTGEKGKWLSFCLFLLEVYFISNSPFCMFL